MMVYAFDKKRIYGRFKVDPQTAGEALEEIKQSNGGQLTSESVLERAKSYKHPLHDCFEWNDSIAAHQFRLNTSRNLIRSIVIVENKRGKKNTIPAFVSVRLNQSYRSYVDVNTIKNEPALIQSVEKSAIKELESWIHRYRSFSELATISLDIRSAISRYNQSVEVSEAEQIINQKQSVA